MTAEDAKLLITYEGSSSAVKDALDNMFVESTFVNEIPIQGYIKGGRETVWFETDDKAIL
jgi:hypothetical protein